MKTYRADTFEVSARDDEASIGFSDDRILLKGNAITILRGELISA